MEILIDDIDMKHYNKYKWCPVNSGNTKYLTRTTLVNGKKTSVKFHREILNLKNPNALVDHINGNGLDNRRSNLRVVNRNQNAQNRKLNINNKTGYKGVRKNQHGTFEVRISVNGKSKYIGTYYKIKDAARAYDIAAEKLHGEFARHNNIDKRISPKKVEKFGSKTRLKMSNAKKGMLSSNSAKPIICLNNNKKYSSTANAARDLNLKAKSISKVLLGQRKTLHGYRFEYIS